MEEFAEHGQRRVRGLWATETELFVSSPLDGTIKVYDTQSMRPLRSWNVERPDRLCLDLRGQRVGSAKAECRRNVEVAAFHAREAAAAAEDRISGRCHSHGNGRRPSNRLLVADAGADQQIKIYDAIDTAPRLKATLGAKGGIFAGPVPGKFGDLRFNRPAAIGVDDHGNVYVASSGATAGGSTVLECYSPDGQCRWRRLGLEFIDLADIDPGRRWRRVHQGRTFRSSIGSKPAGLEWSYRGYTVNP